MRTTLDLDRDLLERARKALGASSFTEAIETALKEAVSRVEARSAWARVMTSGLSWNDVDELLEYRRRHGGRSV